MSVVQSFKSEAVRQTWRDKLDDAFRGATIIIERYTKPIAVLMGYDEYQRLKELENKVLWAESKRIADKNDRDESWIDGSEMDRRMVERGIFTAEELGLPKS